MVHGRWRFVLPDGEELPPQPIAPDEPFPVLARTDPFAIHACLQRRELLLALGGFDSSLVTCEDWDLFQRMARAGARFASVDRLVALYRLRGGSAMSMTNRLARDAVTVIERGHRPDPRVPEPDARYEAGADPAGLGEAVLMTAAWIAALAIGRGARFEEVLAAVGEAHEAALDPAAVADSVADALPRGVPCPPSLWPELWLTAARPVGELLDALQEIARAPGLAGRAGAALERRALERAAPRDLTAIGRMAAMELELAAPTADVALPDGVEKL